jgi:hypothetical protein
MFIRLKDVGVDVTNSETLVMSHTIILRKSLFSRKLQSSNFASFFALREHFLSWLVQRSSLFTLVLSLHKVGHLIYAAGA